MAKEASSGLRPGYGSVENESFIVKYRARCHCGAVRYEVGADPVDAKICHCRACRVLHGAPMQWAAIFHKRDVRLVLESKSCASTTASSTAARGSCLQGELRALRDTDRRRRARMWLAFPTLFDFGTPPQVPDAFRPSCHIFYATRVMDVDDGLPKWSGHKDESTLLDRRWSAVSGLMRPRGRLKRLLEQRGGLGAEELAERFPYTPAGGIFVPGRAPPQRATEADETPQAKDRNGRSVSRRRAMVARWRGARGAYSCT